jgi:hypothetical protein
MQFLKRLRVPRADLEAGLILSNKAQSIAIHVPVRNGCQTILT